MDLSLAVAIPPGYGLLRADDLEAIKAAVLYGDRVHVVMHLSTHMTTGLLLGVPQNERAAFLLRSTTARVVERAGYPDASRMAELTNRLTTTMRDYATLHDSGVVRLDLFGEDDTYGEVEVNGEPALIVRLNPDMAKFGEHLGKLMSSPSMHLVLLAAEYGRGPATPPQRSHTGLGMELLTRLPRFGDASLAEIIDIREELAGPLVRFRAAAVELASAGAGTEPIETIWLSSVAPALQELEESVIRNRYLRRLAERLLSPTDGIASVASIAVSVTTLSGVPEMLAAGLGAALPALRAGWDRRIGSEAGMRHRLFFLHQVERRLKQQA